MEGPVISLNEIYKEKGLTVLELLPKSKQCVINNWQVLSPQELMKCFKPDANIGLRLDGLTAVDIEREELWDVLIDLNVEVMASKTWVQKTGKGYHIIFRGETKPFKVDGFVELRSGSRQYIVVPPSIHPETNRPYEWLSDIQKVPIAEISKDDLERLRHKLEVLKRYRNFIEAMVEYWRRYHRHNLSLWISGVLYKIGLPFEDAETVLKTITCLARDEEINDRVRALRDTYEKPAGRVKAWSGLREELLEIVGDRAAVINILKTIPIYKSLLFEVKSLKDLVENAREISYIVKPIIPRGALILLAGRGGIGKSLLTLHMAHCIANGKPLFDYFDTTLLKVLLLDNENSPSIYRERVKLLRLNSIEPIDTISFTNFRLDKKGAIAKLRTLITTNGYGIVFLDNWTTFTSITDENKAAEVSNLLTRLRKLAYETNCTIVLIHHLRKSLPYSHNVDEVRGSSVLVNESDSVLLLEKSVAPNERIVRTLKNRLGEEFAFRLNFRYDEEGILNIEYTGEVEETFDSNLIKAANEVKTFMQVKKIAKRGEIFKTIKGYSKTTLKRALNYLLIAGELVREGWGVYRVRESLDTELEG